MPKVIQFDVPPIEEDLEWINAQGKVNVDTLIASAGGTVEGQALKELKQEFKRSPALSLMRSVIAKRYQASQAQISQVQDPAWPYKVAYLEGYRKALREIYQSIPNKDKDNGPLL